MSSAVFRATCLHLCFKAHYDSSVNSTTSTVVNPLWLGHSRSWLIWNFVRELILSLTGRDYQKCLVFLASQWCRSLGQLHSLLISLSLSLSLGIWMRHVLFPLGLRGWVWINLVFLHWTVSPFSWTESQFSLVSYVSVPNLFCLIYPLAGLMYPLITTKPGEKRSARKTSTAAEIFIKMSFVIYFYCSDSTEIYLQVVNSLL